jgi:copper(I)-binding protein
VAAALLAACGGSGEPSELAADGAWSRPTPTGAADGVLYLTVTSDVDDALVAVEVPASIASSAELHVTSSDDGNGGHSGHHGGGGGSGEVSMAEVDQLEVPAGERVTLEPGGHHVMLIGLAEPLVDGETFPITLRFASGRSVRTDAVVADNPPG